MIFTDEQLAAEAFAPIFAEMGWTWCIPLRGVVVPDADLILETLQYLRDRLRIEDENAASGRLEVGWVNRKRTPARYYRLLPKSEIEWEELQRWGKGEANG